ncbi:DUF11 domain-containing protein [Ruminococcus sp. AF17-22AC]|uniref:COG1470 family protein n=1 Tax=Ruminococcus sp. AF17-22AC TaxID=2292248 RepID=UPI000E4BF81F|nr:DUF11 domain-containing protein [Ruminococcus sp. AF17-22AC]RGU33041.1 DUF11 domain-containing protein [Ruminococcus sp. AF17-22AC]
MKNRIMRKIAAAGMAVFLVGMSAGSGYMWKDVSVYAAEAGQRKEACIDAGDSMKQSAGTEKPAVREDKETVSEANEMNVMENVTEEIVGASETVGIESILDEAELPDNALPRIGSEDSEEISDNLFSENENADSFSDSSGDTDTNLQADLSLSVQAEDDTIKAGSDLVYTITAENTGECDLKDLRISYNFSEKGLSGEWSEGAKDAVGNTAYIEKLEASATKIVYLTVHLPEERTTAVSLALTAAAGKVSGDNDTGEAEEIVKNAELVTQIQALQATFEVTKTADRSMAVPGDEIRFLICIRNTGERTLHSIVTTERFQLGNVPVRFLEKDGVRLNKSKTKAKIEQIEPGEAFGLEAVVTLPEGLEDQNLVNEVSVTTLETGEQTKIAQSEIQVKAAEEEKQKETNADIDGEMGSEQDESRPASTHPKTGDPYQPFLWLFMIPGSVLAVGWLRSRM